MLPEKSNSPIHFAFCIFLGILLFLLFTSCRKADETPGVVLERFFHLLNAGEYKKAAMLCSDEIDPDLLDFTYIVSLRFMDRVIVEEVERAGDEVRCHVYLILKDGKELVYYSRTREGKLLPSTMRLEKIKDERGQSGWKVVCRGCGRSRDR